MANDLLILKCRGCGEIKMLAKYYPTLGHGVKYPDGVAEWVWHHMQCSPNFGGLDLGGDRCFDLFAESDDRYIELRDSRPTPP